MRVTSRSDVKIALAALAALAACAVAPSLQPLQALQAQGGRMVRVRTPDTTRTDTVFSIRISPDPGDVMRLIAELVASRQTEERVAMSLRESGNVDGGHLRDLEAQLSAIARRNAALSSAIRLTCAREDMQPDGYMGVNFEGIEIQRVGDGPAIYTFMSKPRILSVEPGSPAQRAGIEADDELLAIAGNDAAKPLPLGALLKPGAKLSVRVSRDGQPHEMTVIVAKRPDDYGSACSGLDDMLSSSRLPPLVAEMRRATAPTAPTGGVAAGGFGGAGGGGTAPARAGASSFAFVTPYAGAGPNLIGGAQFLPLDAGWREAIGIDRGLLVLSVAPGSPADNAGLRKSDVILAVGDSGVTSIGQLWRMVGQSGAAGLAMKVQRAKQPIMITFKPRPPR